MESTSGQTAGFDIDQLALASAAGGAAAPVSTGGQLPAVPVSATPPATVTSQTATTLHVDVDGVTPATAPFVLVMGQSINAGWQATVDGHSLGAPTLVDGFANGWTVDPAALAGDLAGGRLVVTLRWVPQRRVNVALIVSALTIAACLVLAFLPRRRRRLPRRPGWLPRSGGWGRLRWPSRWRRREEDVPLPVHADDQPLVAVPFGSEGPRSPVLVAVAVGLGTGAVAAAITAPRPGLVVGVATAVVLLVPRARFLLGLAAVGLVAAGGVYVLVEQARHLYMASGTWPANFGTAGNLVWAGVVFLGADATVEVVGRWRARRMRGPTYRGTPPDEGGSTSDAGVEPVADPELDPAGGSQVEPVA